MIEIREQLVSIEDVGILKDKNEISFTKKHRNQERNEFEHVILISSFDVNIKEKIKTDSPHDYLEYKLINLEGLTCKPTNKIKIISRGMI